MNRLSLVMTITLLGIVDSVGAVGPMEDFGSWYIETVALSSAAFKYHAELELLSEEPLKIEAEEWSDEGFGLRSFDVIGDDSFRVLKNPNYSAVIVASYGQSDPVWTMRDFARRSDKTYPEVSRLFQTSFRGISKPAEIFSRQTSSSRRTADDGRETIELTFDPPRPGDSHKVGPEAMTVVLRQELTFGEENEWLPDEILYRYHNGNEVRLVFKSWQLVDDRAVISSAECFARTRGESEFKIYQRQKWEELEKAPPDHDKCYLSYYGLPEPEGKSAIPFWCWITAAIATVLVGLFLMTRS